MTESKRVVVTGLGCVSPLGNTVVETWEKGSQGQSGIDRIEKFDPSEMRCQIAGEVRNFELPDLVPPKEAKKMDLFIHYAIAATQEALQDAALEITEPLEEEVGISMGVGIGGLGCIEKYTKILLEQGPKRVSPFFIPMTLSNLAPGQVSMLFRARNYSACSVSACASSNHAIGTAMRHIERGDAKVMISGGAESSVTPLGIAGFAAMHALSTRNEEPQKASRPYDTGRDGFVMGEGAGILIFEELERARSRGAKIYAEVKGYGSTDDAFHITAPKEDGSGPARAFKRAMSSLSSEIIKYHKILLFCCKFEIRGSTTWTIIFYNARCHD